MVAVKRANVVAGAIVAAIVLMSLACWLGLHPKSEATAFRALVHDGNGAVYELPLSEDAERVIVTDLGTNVVQVQDGAVFVREADCANQDCVHQGKLSGPGTQIICLPHKLWIEVVAEGQDGGRMDVGKASEGEESYDVVAR